MIGYWGGGCRGVGGGERGKETTVVSKGMAGTPLSVTIGDRWLVMRRWVSGGRWWWCVRVGQWVVAKREEN